MNEAGYKIVDICHELSMDRYTVPKYIDIDEVTEQMTDKDLRINIHELKKKLKEEKIKKVLDLDEKGFSQSAIARDLGLSRVTVKKY